MEQVGVVHPGLRRLFHTAPQPHRPSAPQPARGPGGSTAPPAAHGWLQNQQQRQPRENLMSPFPHKQGCKALCAAALTLLGRADAPLPHAMPLPLGHSSAREALPAPPKCGRTWELSTALFTFSFFLLTWTVLHTIFYHTSSTVNV